MDRNNFGTNALEPEEGEIRSEPCMPDGVNPETLALNREIKSIERQVAKMSRRIKSLQEQLEKVKEDDKLTEKRLDQVKAQDIL